MESVELRIAGTWDGTPIPAAEQVVWRISAAAAALRIEVEAPFYDDPPPKGEPGPSAGLWNFEVVELFVVGSRGAERPSETEYTELELSPHGHYLLLRLRGIRQITESLLPIRYRARILGDRWHGEALLPRRLLPPPPHRVNAFAIHGVGGDRRYLAMTPVPGSEPDFHRISAFKRLELPCCLSRGSGFSTAVL